MGGGSVRSQRASHRRGGDNRGGEVADQRPAPADIDPSVPNGARIYDYMLGGKDHFASDQAAAEAMIAANPGAPGTARANRAFLRRPDEILAHPETRRLIDFDQPVAVLLVAILHFIPDEEDPAGIVARLRDAMAPGSHLVVSHTANESPAEVMAAAQQGFRLAGAPLTPRTRAQIGDLFDGFELVEPGLVEVSQWRPETPQKATAGKSPWTIVGGVGRKR